MEKPLNYSSITEIAGIAVSRETMERLKQYQALLEKWQAKINLISPTTLPDAWMRHFEDSAQVAAVLPAQTKDTRLSLYDLGSGAGFPGLVLAIMRKDVDLTLVESDSKKCAFLQTVSRETGVSVRVDNRRIEAAAADLPAPDIISARALASLSELLALCGPWIEINPALILIFPKGARAAEEIADARKKWDFQCSEMPSQTEPGATILTLTHCRRV
jgi:16S rRNA (guanine527-N7)-methyltransferase